MALQSQGVDQSERIFAELRSKNSETKARAASELRDYIVVCSRGEGVYLLHDMTC